MMIRYHLYSMNPKEEPKSKPVAEPWHLKQPRNKTDDRETITVPKAEPVEQKHRPSRQDNPDEIRRQLENHLEMILKRFVLTLIEKRKANC